MSDRFRRLAASSVMAQQASEDRVEWLEIPSEDGNGTRVWGLVKSGRRNLLWRSKMQGGQFRSTDPHYLWEGPKTWDKLKRKVRRFFGKVVGKKDDDEGRE